MSGRAEVVRKAAIVNAEALPGREPAKKASEVNETPDGRQPQLQQRQLYHKGSQHNENAKSNIPSAHGVLLKGEWRVCVSGRVRGHGCRADKSSGQENESRGWAKASTVLNTRETAAMGVGGGTGARSDAGGARHNRAGPDGHANWLDALSGHRDVPDIRNSMNTTADATESISTCRNTPQMQNLPVDTGRHDQAKPRSHAGTPNMRVDTHGIAIHVNTAGDTQKHVSTCTEGTKLPDLLTRSTRPCRDGTDGLESHADMQMARIHVQDIGNKSNESANMSVKLDLPANGAKPCIGEPKWLESPTDMSDAYTRMQSVAVMTSSSRSVIGSKGGLKFDEAASRRG